MTSIINGQERWQNLCKIILRNVPEFHYQLISGGREVINSLKIDLISVVKFERDPLIFRESSEITQTCMGSFVSKQLL